MPVADRPNHVESVARLSADAIAQDPELQSSVKRMVEQMVANVGWTMAWGTTQDKAALMKAVVPAMVRSMTAVEGGKQLEQEQAAYDRMREALGGEK